MLKKRLLSIAKYVPKDSKVADIGCDHAYLAIYLVQNNIAKTVIASDIVEGPLEAAHKNVLRAQVQDKIYVRKSDGLQNIVPGEVDCVVIAGMGAGTIMEILDKGSEVLKQCHTVIVQSMIGTEMLREYFPSKGWRITQEDLCLENNKLYEIMSAKPDSTVVAPSLLDKYIGLLAEHELFPIHLDSLIHTHESMLKSLNLAKDKQSVADKVAYTEMLLLMLRKESEKHNES